MGNPSSGAKVETTMSLSKARHRPSASAGASLQVEKLEKSSSNEKLPSGTLSPRTTEEQYIAAFLGDKKMKRRTQSSLRKSEDFTKGLELHGLALIAEERKPLSSMSFRGHRRAGSGSATPKASESPRAKGTSTVAPVMENPKIAASLFYSPTKLERSASLSRVAHRIIPDAGGNPRPRTGVGSGTLPAVKGTLPYCHGNDENSNPDPSAVPGMNFQYHPHGILVSTAETRPNYEHLYFNAAYLPVKDIHPVCLEKCNTLHLDQATTPSTNLGHDPHGTARSPLLPNGPSTQQFCSSKGSTPNGLDAASFHLELHSENLSKYQSLLSDRSKHPDVLSLSNSPREIQGSNTIASQPSPTQTSSVKQSSLDLSHPDVKEIMLPRTSIGKVTEAELTEAAVLSSLVCENLPADPLPKMKECKQVRTDASHARDVKEASFSRFGLRKINGPDLSLRKSASFEPGLEEKARVDLEKKSKLRKRRRSVSASGIGAMLLKVVHVSDSRAVDTNPMSEHRVSDADPVQSQVPQPTPNLVQDDQVKIEAKIIETVDMDVEFEDCSTELGTPDTEACHVEDSTSINDAKLSSNQFIKRQLVSDRLLVCKNLNSSEGCQSDSLLRDPQAKRDEVADNGSSHLSNDDHEIREASSEKIGDCKSLAAGDLREEPLLEKGIPHAKDIVQDCDSCLLEIKPRSGRQEKLSNQDRFSESARLHDHRVHIKEGLVGSRRRRTGSRGTLSLDMDSSTEWQPKNLADIAEAKTETEHAQSKNTYPSNRHPLSLLEENASSQEQPRNFASMLQVSTPHSADDHRWAPSSIFILANPSCSSSQQDRLWEEQAEAYSSGGRGTPGREDDASAVNSNVYLHSPSPGGAISSDDLVHCPNAASSLRKSQELDSLRARSCSGFSVSSDNGRNHADKRKSGAQSGKKRGRPRTPLRTLLAEDLHGRTPASGFLQQFLSRIKGSSSSASKSSSQTIPKRRHSGAVWSSCLCFS